MHKFLRAVGFSSIKTRDQLKSLISHTIANSSERSFTTYEGDVLLAEYRLEYGDGIGFCICGELDEKDNFLMEYSFPYCKGKKESSKEHSVIERHASTISFAGVCEDNRIGISVIYYLLNRMDYIKQSYVQGDFPTTTLTLSGLSNSGTIVMPLEKKSYQGVSGHNKRDKLIEAARKGDGEAMESLTLDDLDVYSTLSQKIKKTDVYTLVESSFMPYGVECDQYSVLGEIIQLSEVTNSYTNEQVYRMTVLVNGIPMDICINKEDLFGEPMVGRRFKGTVWLQGILNYQLS